MIRQSKTTVKELTAQYRGVLKHAFLASMATFAFAVPANAAIEVSDADELVSAIKEIDTTGNTTETIKLKNSITDGQGLFLSTGKNNDITFDLNNKTITFAGAAVGSSSTENQAIHAEKGNALTIQNGTLDIDESTDGFKFLIQNYSELALDNVTLDGTNLDIVGGKTPYTLSNNNGTTNIKNSTIIGSGVPGAKAFDVYYYGNATYGDVIVNLEDSNVYGDIEIDAAATAQNIPDHAKLNLKGSNVIDGDITNEGTINANIEDDASSTFKGRIANTGVLNINNGMFKDNISELNGGSIYNEGTTSITGGELSGNTARNGGAIYNTGIVNIDGTIFASNTATGPSGNIMGAAIDNRGTLNITGKAVFNDNVVDAPGTLDSPVKPQNQSYGAAIYNAGSAATIADESEFNRNAAGRGGAIFQNSGTLEIGDSVKFNGNTATYAAGGAIHAKNGFTIGDNVSFSNNTAKWGGGAIYSALSATETVPEAGQISTISIGENAIFENNGYIQGSSTWSYGAIYNEKGIITIGDNALFKDNVALSAGAAIYNADTINLGSVVFANNKVDGGSTSVLNDIYNIGTINFNGDVTLDGGIAGTGIVVFDADSVLKATLGTTTIAGNEVTANGAKLDLIIANGTQNGHHDFVTSGATDKFTFGDNAFYNLSMDDGQVVVERKSMAQQTTDLAEYGFDENTSKTLAAMAGVSDTGNAVADELFAKLTEVVQSKDEGAVGALQDAVDAINPETVAVVQSATMGAQNTVNTLTAGRMVMPSLGRSGGDAAITGGGVWVQGLYNKSKNGDKFSGDTRGIAAGIDGKINDVAMIGAGYAFGSTDVNALSRDTDIDTNTVFVYGQYKPSQWYANATLNYSMSKYNESGAALGVPVTADYKSNAFGANVATGYDFASGVTPEFGLRYLHVSSDEYTNSLGLKNKFDDSNFLTGMFGARYGFDIVASDSVLFRPEFSAAAKYDMLSDASKATVALPGVDAYTLDGERLSRFGGEFGAGLTMSYYGFDLSLNYLIDVRKDYTSQTGMAKFRYNF